MWILPYYTRKISASARGRDRFPWCFAFLKSRKRVSVKARIQPWTLFPGITDLKRTTLCVSVHTRVGACVAVFCSQRGINLNFGYRKCSHTSVFSSSALSHVTIIASYQTSKKNTERVWFGFRRLEYSCLRFQVSQFALFLKYWGTVTCSCGQRLTSQSFFPFFSLKIYIDNKRSAQYLCFLWITDHDHI